MRRIAVLLTCLSFAISIVACSNQETSSNQQRTMVQGTSVDMITGSMSITGKVTQIYGNELVLRLAEGGLTSTQSTSGRGEMATGMADMTDEDKSAMRENMTSADGTTGGRGEMGTNMADMTDEDKSAMRENMTSADGTTGGRGEMATSMADMSNEDKATMRENMTSADGTTGGRGQFAQSNIILDSEEEDDDDDEDTATSSDITTSSYVVSSIDLGKNLVNSMSISLPTSIILNGGSMGGDMSGSDDRTAMRENMTNDMSSEDRTAMRENMTGNQTTTSTADIVLTNDVAEYTIPVSVPVYSSGTALSFSQISKDAYITIHMNDEGNIVSVIILG